jgi:hypothetical protein
MTERFGGELRPDTIPDRIAAALNYNQSRPVAKRWKDVEAGVRNWLIKDCDSLKGTKRPVKAAAPPELSLEERIKRGHQRNLENAERMRRAGIDYEWDDEPYPEEAKQ